MTDTSPRPLAQVPQRASLREVLTVSSRGQITLPAEMHRHLGIEPGGAVIVEDCGGELRLKPAAVLEVELYSDEDIAAWDQADALSDQERQQILKRLRQGRSTPQPRTQSSCWLT
ncbi:MULTISPECIES: AbrB/MazE/SpoVT family DNA-binding domain-containing protein [unclassified Cyanobium]|uniref:AbrB/MazE/SpoVT family DNA-binding domain-containing protein n=1 Tax=unclassified Cyanobium TaxID=2627006 RepID=UPI0020CE1419|nr:MULTISPECIES: AbrB/MazE/SpoVT family DNA-binding domain-containing protein [unclassified Cyanobium]MCP9859337.1 AbrB/MazE/SpoVT family DNA-binding domain-containing protein [Cyanobium sp. Cruz-8H5]MCP9866638.1 AbrB/MazE/SpoVT family DNA-binding domain-containing protein [Cyanobium sp. Cruz-8D1]